jgi:ligand-binding SRPBCC domain-containing protein
MSTRATFELSTAVWLPRRVEEVFPFFGDAHNLDVLTPPWLHFRILTPAPIDMRAGTLIDYRISLRGLPMTWRTRITEWDPNRRFVDEQVRGPYLEWIHAHDFESLAGGTLMRDTVPGPGRTSRQSSVRAARRHTHLPLSPRGATPPLRVWDEQARRRCDGEATAVDGSVAAVKHGCSIDTSNAQLIRDFELLVTLIQVIEPTEQ